MALQIPGYRVIRKINQGGMATVYLAIQISVGRIVALKVMNPLLNTDPAFSERFQSEATIVGQLSHPSIVSIYDIGHHQGLNYIAMDYLPNGSVHEKMMEGIQEEEALSILKQIASALDHAHEKGYIHRDIKPENILFRADNTAVLTDFGVAKGVGMSSRMTQAGTVVGTPHYMSPEQSKGIDVNGRADLYSLGVVFFEMLTGTLPYQGDEAVTVALKHISEPLPKLPAPYAHYQPLLDKLLAKDPEQRFQRGKELVTAIEEIELIQRSSSLFLNPNDQPDAKNLLKQLFNIITAAIYRKWRKLKRLRWTRTKGAYLKTATDLDQVCLEEAINTNRQSELETQIHKDFLLKRKIQFRWKITGAMLIISILFGLGVFIHTPNSSTNLQLISSSSGSSAFSASSTQPTALSGASSTSGQSVSNVSRKSSRSVSRSSNSTSSIATYRLIVITDPKQSQIRILNIRDSYEDGIQLPPGKYQLEVSHPEYETQKQWVTIQKNDLNVQLILKKIEKPIVAVEKTIPKKEKIKRRTKPLMINIPAGSFLMGSRVDSTASPVHTVEVPAFKISQTEITFSEYDYFAKETGRESPSDNRWGRDTRPVINVSWQDANAYTEWLSKLTGKKYRLPTESEWEYAARANKNSDYWWGNNIDGARDQANCRRGCNSKFSGLFGSKTAPVGTYPANAFGLYDTLGNVAEWVEDCYAADFQFHPRDGSAYQLKQCTRRVVRGGSTKDDAGRITNFARDYYPPEMGQENVGFRVVEEL